MARKPRHLPRPDCLVEVTVRTVHSRYLLRPSRELNRTFAGCLGKALDLFPVRLHAVVVLSNHFHLLLSPEDSRQLADFMGHLKGNLSKKVGRLQGWSGSMFDRRYQSIPVSDEPAAQVARLRYLLSHGCKEGLVYGPRDWPGVHSVAALCNGKAIHGTWINRTAYRAACNRGEDVEPRQFATEYAIALEPLPCWEHLAEADQRERAFELVDDIRCETRANHRLHRTAPMGVRSLLRRHPHDKPVKEKRSRAPMFHAATRAMRTTLRNGFSAFLAEYREASSRVLRGDRSVSFPPDCFPPGLPYSPAV